MTISVTLPWPNRLLHPNARPHWAAKAKAVKDARANGNWFTWAAFGCQPTKPNWKGARLSVTFSPPDKRRRDLDGMIASHKAAQDGIADALGVDDSKFEVTYTIGPPIKGGAVIVHIEEMK